MRARLDELLWLLPLTLLIAALLVLPSINIFFLSFKNQRLLGQKVDWVGLDNYIKLLGSQYFWNAFVNTLVYASCSTVFQAVLGLAVALLLSQKIRGIRILRSLILYPYMISSVVAAVLFKWIFNPASGIAPTILVELGIWNEPMSIFGSTSTAMAGTILVTVWKFLPFVSIMVLARLLLIPSELYEAARIDGASFLETFRYITLPQLKGVFGTVLLLRFIWTFGLFSLIWLLTGGGPVRSTEVLATLAYRQAFKVYALSVGCTTAIYLFLVVFGFSIVYLKYLKTES